jgi:predicted RNA binding protein YcfA (HicA-like mRNA interferase family)
MDRLEHWARNPHNVRFEDLCNEAERLGFELMGVRGSHHKYRHPILRAKIVLSPGRGGKAAAYQIRQLRDLALSYGLARREGT